MYEPTLHAFDHALSDHVVAVTRIVAAENPTFGRMIEAELPGLTGEASKPELLLSEWDLRLIEAAAAFALVRDRWVPDVLAYEHWIGGLGDIHGNLGDFYAAAWQNYSLDAVELLESADFRFDVGVEIVRGWVEEARRMLRAIGRTDLLPRPTGGHATWALPERQAVGSDATSDSARPSVVPDVPRHEPPASSLRRPEDVGEAEEVGTGAAAEILGCSKHTVIGYVRDGQLAARNAARVSSSVPRWRINLRSLLAFRLAYENTAHERTPGRAGQRGSGRRVSSGGYKPVHVRPK